MSFFGSRQLLCFAARSAVSVQTKRLPQPSRQLRWLSSTDTKTEPENVSEPEQKIKLDLEKANQEIAMLKEKTLDLDDKFKRSLADVINIRKRMLEQIQDAKLFGIQNFCKDLLEVADVLEKAIESTPKSEINDKNPHLKNLHEGVLMIGSQLNKVFRKHGLETLDPLDEAFDPNFHEALLTQHIDGKEPGVVFTVSKIGYKLQNRVIRPALVGVTK